MYQHASETDQDDLRGNDKTVTVGKLRVALRTKARTIQPHLSHLLTNADTHTVEGLCELLQQVANLLLEYSEFWSYVFASSEMVDGWESAEELFNRYLIEEQSKCSGEKPPKQAEADAEKARERPKASSQPEYIVLTILLGFEADEPLFEEIYSASLLRDVLQNMSMARSLEIRTFELIWQPQLTMDHLTEEEISTEYGDMVAID